MRKVALLPALIALLAVQNLRGQSDRTEFDAVSIKAAQPGQRGGGYNLSPGRLNAKNQSLRDLMKFAFGVEDFQLSGGSGWLNSEHYEILATCPGETTNGDLRKMMRAMLADRFALATHRESKNISGYALHVAKTGPRLKLVEPEQHGMMLGRNRTTGQRILTATSAGMAELAIILTTLLSQPVEDRTGLEGVFDFAMEWSPDEMQPALLTSGKQVQVEAVDGATGPSIFTAIQKTLGLTLTAQKVPVELIVIDHAEKAAAN